MLKPPAVAALTNWRILSGEVSVVRVTHKARVSTVVVDRPAAAVAGATVCWGAAATSRNDVVTQRLASVSQKAARATTGGVVRSMDNTSI